MRENHYWPSDQGAPYSSTARKRAYPKRSGTYRNQSRESRKYLFILGSLLVLVTGMLIGLIINSGGSNQVSDMSPDIASQLTISSEDAERSPIPTSDEPVASVAETVAPSVVRIDTATGTGSGIIYDQNGSVVTNAHVVLGADTVEIQLADGTRATGKVLGSDPAVDIAIV